MRKRKLAYRYTRERNFSQITEDQEGIDSNCNSITFFNIGTVDAFLQVNATPILLESGANFSFDNESPLVMESTHIEKLYFKEGQTGEKRVLIIKSLIKPYSAENIDGFIQ